jgi:hypothetical protein
MFDDLGYLMLSFITTTLDYNPNKLRVNPLNLATITFLATEPDHSGMPGAAGVLPCFSAVLFLRLWYFTPSMTMDEIYSFGYVKNLQIEHIREDLIGYGSGVPHMRVVGLRS